jgi:hypothetical protein
MKRIIRLILAVGFILAFIAILLFLSRMQKENIRASLPVSGRLIDLSTKSVAPARQNPGAGKSTRAKASPEWGELILDALDLNLDEDEELEQVIVVKDSDSGRRTISVVIADFQPVTGSYFRTWKSATRATKSNAFIVQPRDLLHDGTIELLCFGLDDENRQTLDVFRKIPKRSTYVNVFSAAGVDIAIEEESDSASITVYQSLENGAAAQDRKKSSFAWDSRRGKYTLRSETIVPGAAIEQLFLGDTLSGKTSDFETYLNGLWLLSDSGGAGATALSFDAERRKITISDSRDQEEWDWSESNASRSGLYASISNSSLPELIQLLNIELIGMDKIKVRATSQQSVRFSTRENWNGEFRRYSGIQSIGPQPSIRPIPGGQGIIAPIQDSSGSAYITEKAIYGKYGNSEGLGLEFSQAGFEQSDPKTGASERGSYHFFVSDSSVILELVSLAADGRTESRKDYIFELRQAGNEHNIVLKPASMAEGKVSLIYKPDMVLARLKDQGSK